MFLKSSFPYLCRRFIDIKAVEMARWRRRGALANTLSAWIEAAVVARRSAVSVAVSVGTFKFQVLQRAHVSDDLSILRSFRHVCYETREGLDTANRHGMLWDFAYRESHVVHDSRAI
jgi:hypothetical protein